MSFKLPSMTRETSSTTGTGDRSLAGAISGYLAVSVGLSDQDTTWARISLGSDFEEGLYTYNSGANSLTPTTIYRSTNSNSAVNFGAGTKDVAIILPGPSDIPAADLASFRALLGISAAGGFLNKFRNGTMDIWQRGTSMTITTSGGYTADGWIVVPTGASVAISQFGGSLTANTLKVTGASSVTDVIVKQRIEGVIAAALTSQTVTVQARVYNNTGGSITPTLTVGRPGSLDTAPYNNLDVNGVSLQACANGTATVVAYTFSANPNTFDGLEISFDFGNNFSSNAKYIAISECDIRVTPNVPTGLTAAINIPPPELRAIANEAILCARYYLQITNPKFIGIAGSASNVSRLGFTLEAPMRAAPTLTLNGTLPVFYGTSGGATSTTTLNSISTNYSTTQALEFDGGTSASVMSTGYPAMIYQSGTGSISASAEL